MRIFKFGGASVKDAKSIQNLGQILKRYQNEDLWVVISAMGKMTNQLEVILGNYFLNKDCTEASKKFEDYHISILDELFPFRGSSVYTEIYECLENLEKKLAIPSSNNFSKEYSEIVSYGEIISTKIVSAYLSNENILNEWVDVRDIIKSKDGYRQVDIDWGKTASNFNKIIAAENDTMHSSNIKLTQGFIASNNKRETTTLGREGSDFTGAILAWCLNAKDLTIWKDVPGLMNADPNKFSEAVLLEKISYREALELSFYGASVIHPKTIKPLQNKQISLNVKSFLHPDEKGTLIQDDESNDNSIPSFISKSDQILFSISPRDFSMVVEKNISDLYGIISDNGININLMQNSALNFSICFDYNEMDSKNLQEDLHAKYKLLYNKNLELLTVRHYNDEIISKLLKGRQVLLEQKSRHTARYLLKE